MHLCEQWAFINYENMCTDKKEKKIFLTYKKIQLGAVAKSYMRKGFLIYEEMRKYLVKYEEAVSHIWLYNCSLRNFVIYEENFLFFFITVETSFLRKKTVSLECSQGPCLLPPEQNQPDLQSPPSRGFSRTSRISSLGWVPPPFLRQLTPQKWLPYTVIRFVLVSAKFGACTIATETLVEAKMCTFTLESTILHFYLQ